MSEAMPSPWKTRAGRAQDRDVKREAVLRAAARSFTEKGFHETSLDDVAESLNVSKPTLYYYAKSKNDILFDCVRIGLERLSAATDEAQVSAGTGRDRLVALWTEYVRIVTEDFGRCLILIGEDPLPAQARRELRALKSQVDRRFRSFVEAGMADGSLRRCDARLAAFVSAGALSWIARWFDPKGEMSVDEVAQASIDMLLRGLAPEAARADGA